MTYVAIPDSDLDQDSPMKEGVLRQLRDNALALGSGNGLPDQMAREAFRIATATFAGTVGGNPAGSTALERGADLSLPKGSFFPRSDIGGPGASWTGHTVDGGSADFPRFRYQVGGLLNIATVNFEFDVNYILDEAPVFGFVNLDDSILAAEEAITSEIMLGLGDLAGSVVQGAVGAPKVNRQSVETSVTNLAGTIPAGSGIADIFIEDLTFFPNFHSTGSDDPDSNGGVRNPAISFGRTILDLGPPVALVKQGDISLSNTGSASESNFDIDFRYISSRTASGTFVAVTPSDLGPNAIIREGSMEGKLRDNTLAILNGGSNAPGIVVGALNLSQRSFAGTVLSGGRVELILDPYMFFPMFHTTMPFPSTTVVIKPPRFEMSRTDTGSADSPRVVLGPAWADPAPAAPSTGYSQYTYDVDYHYLVNS